MNSKVALFLILAFGVLGGYVLLEHGGKFKLGNVVEIESNKGRADSATNPAPGASSGVTQNATVQGDGTAANSNNGASVSIGR
ncbi:hypothetical protein [Hydrogenophaga sp. RWCD_12]|uniref:hypothetical protein n=1 Tax=Hydrogenophaga sp. RWCD_12 TaxID=3391190 RepID=UPI0039855CC4